MHKDIVILKHYLLGALTEEETAAIDLRVISDEGLGEELSFAESDLIEDYLERSLTDAETSLFHSNFMVSGARLGHLQEISILKNYARGRDAQKKQPCSREGSRVKFADLLRIYFRPLTIGAAIVVLLVAGLVWLRYLGGSNSALEQQYAVLNKRDLSDTSQLTGYSSVNLSTVSFRDANSLQKQSEEKLTDTVLFRLVAPSKGVDGVTFKAKLSRGTALVFTVESAKAYQNPNGEEIRLLLPKSVLQKGQYQIRLENASGVETGTFSFVID